MDKHPNEPSLTRALHLTPTRFKKPNRQTNEVSNSPMQIGVEFTNGHIVTIQLEDTITLGRYASSKGGHVKVDLSETGELDSGVSRTHAMLQRVDGTIYVRDCDSLNGTYLNGAELYPLRNYAIKDEDILKLGNVKIRIRFMSDE